MTPTDENDDRDRERQDLIDRLGDALDDGSDRERPILCLKCNAGPEHLTATGCKRCGSEEVV